MRASVVRAADKAQLYLVGEAHGRWCVANVIASGHLPDPALRGLLGVSLSAEALLAWAGGAVTSEALSSGGSAWESNPPGTAQPPRNGFEDRGAHRSTPTPSVGAASE